MMWDDFLPLGQALEERFPETDVLSVSDAELARMLGALPMTDGAEKMPESADFFYQVKVAWIQARRTEPADTSMEADL